MTNKERYEHHARQMNKAAVEIAAGHADEQAPDEGGPGKVHRVRIGKDAARRFLDELKATAADFGPVGIEFTDDGKRPRQVTIYNGFGWAGTLWRDRQNYGARREQDKHIPTIAENYPYTVFTSART